MAEYIEKQAAIDELCYVDEYNSRSIATIREMKPADVRPVVRGRWRKIGNNSDGTSDYECSACLGIMMHVPDDDEHPLVSFCSMCGADMRGGDADGDTKD